MFERRIINAVNWRHALGELALIVLGILLALGASDWWDRREAREDEIETLREISEALAADLVIFDEEIAYFTDAAAAMGELLEHIESGRPYDRSLDAKFGMSYGLRLIQLNGSPWESLKSRGLGLVTNRELRARLARTYDVTYANVAEANLVQRNIVLDALRPYYLKHFRDLEFNVTATPIDYDFIASDPEYRNLLAYRRQGIRQGQLNGYPEARAEIAGLIQAIDDEIARD